MDLWTLPSWTWKQFQYSSEHGFSIKSTRTDLQNDTYLPILNKTEVLFSYYSPVVNSIHGIKKENSLQIQIKYLESQVGMINTKGKTQGIYIGHRVASILQ